MPAVVVVAPMSPNVSYISHRNDPAAVSKDEKGKANAAYEALPPSAFFNLLGSPRTRRYPSLATSVGFPDSNSLATALWLITVWSGSGGGLRFRIGERGELYDRGRVGSRN